MIGYGRKTAYYRIFMPALLMAVLFLLSCEEKPKTGENMVQVYYIANDETGVEIHEQERPTGSVEEQIERMLKYLSATPEKLTYKAPLNMGFQVLNADFKEGSLVLNVSKEYLDLSGTTEVLVRAALVKSFTQVNNVARIQIIVEGTQLYDSAGDAVGWMTADQFIHNDGSEINSYEQTRVKLYFANESGDRLIAAYREKFYSTNTALEKFIVEELLNGPSGKIAGLYPTLNPDTKILNVMTKDGICYVNLDSNFLNVVNNVSPELAAYSITDSLTELSNIDRVQLLVNGEVPTIFDQPYFERNLEVVTSIEQESRRKETEEEEE